MLDLRPLVFATLLGLARCDLQLKLLHVVFRHGHKVPRLDKSYPTDPHRNHSYYPVESGGLTNEGMLNEYKIGRMLRGRYDDYLGSIYRPSMVYARSTRVPRTQMSLQLVLAGLFPPSDVQAWNPRLPWIPTSTFSETTDQDNLLIPYGCPRYVGEYERYLNKSYVREVINEYKETMDYLTRHTGRPIETTSAVYYLYNFLKEQAAQNLTLPEWTRSVYPNPMEEIMALDFQLRSATTTLKRLNGGMLLRKIQQDIKNLRNGTLEPSERKVFLFSGHESNVAALARTLGTNDPIIPAYGSTIILETIRDEAHRYYIRVILWTGVSEELLIQRIPGCSVLCPLDRFLEITKSFIPTDEEYECK